VRAEVNGVKGDEDRKKGKGEKRTWEAVKSMSVSADEDEEGTCCGAGEGASVGPEHVVVRYLSGSWPSLSALTSWQVSPGWPCVWNSPPHSESSYRCISKPPSDVQTAVVEA